VSWQAWVLFSAFLSCVPLSNWLISNVGTECVFDGPCLIPVFPGIVAPSGVLIAGASFLLRDLVQEKMGVIWAVLAIVTGGLMSAIVSDPSLAFASVASFVVAESIDLMVFCALRRRGFLLAVVASSLLGWTIDSLVFVFLAFGSWDYVGGQIIGKAWSLLFLVPLLASFRQWRTAVPTCAVKGCKTP
jgi:uncharacterized PurR-regulated membrane protein YhhQ (DUF165 family)